MSQYAAIHEFIGDNPHFQIGRHGDCVGADADFHLILEDYGLTIIGHPPVKEEHRAFCTFNETLEPKDYLVRDRDIVDKSDLMIICPRTFKEEQRSGTWFTARYARKTGKHGLIFWPDGTVDDLIQE